MTTDKRETLKQGGLTDGALKLVKYKARQLVGKAGYTQDDIADIEQDPIVDLLERLPRFDPTKATYTTFLFCVVDRAVCNMLRHRRAEKRAPWREAGSLNDEIGTGGDEPVQRLTAISQDEHDLRTGKHARPAEERNHLRIDMSAALDGLSPELRQAAELLQHTSVRQTARAMGVSESAFRKRHLVQLRKHFKARGMDDYRR
jgi:RNA polymerase sigma-70 factor (ECF subfamily)